MVKFSFTVFYLFLFCLLTCYYIALWIKMNTYYLWTSYACKINQKLANFFVTNAYFIPRIRIYPYCLVRLWMISDDLEELQKVIKHSIWISVSKRVSSSSSSSSSSCCCSCNCSCSCCCFYYYCISTVWMLPVNRRVGWDGACMAKRWKEGRTANLAHCCKYVAARICATTVRIVLKFSYLHNS